MKILMLVFGSRGDVMPYILIAKNLQERGHKAIVVGAKPQDYSDAANYHGVDYIPGDFDLGEILSVLDMKKGGVIEALQTGPKEGIPLLTKLAKSFQEAIVEVKPDVIVCSPWAFEICRHAICQPFFIYDVHNSGDSIWKPDHLFPHWTGYLGRPLILLANLLLMKAARYLAFTGVSTAQAKLLGLNSQVQMQDAVLRIYSYGQGTKLSHDPRVHSVDYIAGAWADEPTEVADFIAEQETYVIAFGSVNRQPQERKRIRVHIKLAARTRPDRNILVITNENMLPLGRLQSNLLVVSATNYAQTFARANVKGVVSHLGKGVIISALRAGLPQQGFAVLGDEFPNGKWLEKLGVTLSTKRINDLNCKNLLAAFDAFEHRSDLRKKAKEVSQLFLTDGAYQVAELIDEALHQADSL